MEQTELSVVNALLECIEETAIQAIDRTHPDVIFALNAWKEQSVNIQSMGWWYNREQYQLSPDARTGEVFLPSGTLAADLAGTTYVKRGRKLYDKELHSFIFDSNTPAEDLLVDCIMEWKIEELPPSVFRLILIDCKMAIITNREQDQVKLQMLSNERSMAYANVQKENLDYMDTSAFDTNKFRLFQSTQPRRY